MIKTMNTSLLHPGLAALVLFTSAITSPLSAQILQSWQFNDVSGTNLTGVANAGPGTASFGTTIAGATTNGTGALRITSNATAAAGRSFVDIADITTGIYRIDVNVAGWNLTGSPALGPIFEFGFSNTTTDSNNSRLAHLYFEANDTGSIVTGLARGVGSTNAGDDITFGLVQSSPVTFRLDVNFDTLSYTVSTSVDNYAFTTGGLISAPASRPATHLQFRAQDNFAISGSTFFAVDSITLSAIPEPSTYAALAGLATLGLAVTRRRRASAANRA
jgi:hypothetical protein